jgi:5-methylcytosine-specific restriction endonuclease McrA
MAQSPERDSSNVEDEAEIPVRRANRLLPGIVEVNHARVPKKCPKLCARAIRERDGNSRQSTCRVLRPDEGSLVHAVPRSRCGKCAWENLVWAGEAVKARKGNRLPHEAGLRLLTVPRAPKHPPVSATIRNAHGIPEWKLFVRE